MGTYLRNSVRLFSCVWIKCHHWQTVGFTSGVYYLPRSCLSFLDAADSVVLGPKQQNLKRLKAPQTEQRRTAQLVFPTVWKHPNQRYGFRGLKILRSELGRLTDLITGCESQLLSYNLIKSLSKFDSRVDDKQVCFDASFPRAMFSPHVNRFTTSGLTTSQPTSS